jgi:small-conductance mechanosensitive channel
MWIFLRVVAMLLLSGLLNGTAMAAAASAEKSLPSHSANLGEDTPLVIFNRTIFVFRGTFLGASPAARAARARLVLEERLRQDGDLQVAVKANPEGQLVMIDDNLAFVVTASDVDPLSGEKLETLAQEAARRLELIVAETREARNLTGLLKSLSLSAVATLVFVAILWCLARFRAWLAGILLLKAEDKVRALKIAGIQIVEGEYLLPLLHRLLMTLRWLLIALLTYQWLGFVLSQFPYTRPWGERLNDYLLSVAHGLLDGVFGAVPGLGVAIAIFFLARFFISFVGRFFERLSQAESVVSWLAPETMPTTRRLVSIGIWLFAVAMAYPYLPGAQTDAFKGLSVLLGLMVSLGASSIVGQGAAGLILTYTRTLRPGEYVRVGEYEGTVVAMGMFTTSIRTGLGEELTIPNALITGSVTKNYSRVVEGRGYVVDTTVTIGYDTPWRQVEALLIKAAQRTPGILHSPAPRVFQTALSDYYPEYRLVAQALPSQPTPRAEVLTLLHANIQDVFNEYGVQIMSPHYMADAPQAKLVKPEDWYAAPASKAPPA